MLPSLTLAYKPLYGAGHTRLGGKRLIDAGYRLRYDLESSVDNTEISRNALSDLKLQRLDVIHAGEETFLMERRVRAVALSRLLDDLQPLI